MATRVPKNFSDLRDAPAPTPGGALRYDDAGKLTAVRAPMPGVWPYTSPPPVDQRVTADEFLATGRGYYLWWPLASAPATEPVTLQGVRGQLVLVTRSGAITTYDGQPITLQGARAALVFTGRAGTITTAAVVDPTVLQGVAASLKLTGRTGSLTTYQAAGSNVIVPASATAFAGTGTAFKDMAPGSWYASNSNVVIAAGGAGLLSGSNWWGLQYDWAAYAITASQYSGLVGTLSFNASPSGSWGAAVADVVVYAALYAFDGTGVQLAVVNWLAGVLQAAGSGNALQFMPTPYNNSSTVDTDHGGFNHDYTISNMVTTFNAQLTTNGKTVGQIAKVVLVLGINQNSIDTEGGALNPETIKSVSLT
jgi:hypothetical protein